MTPSDKGPEQQQHPGQMTGVDDPIDALATRIEALWRRVMDIERSIAVQEWWMLGRALPEARLLAEIASLLAVARGELETVLGQVFSRALPMSGQMDALPGGGQEPMHPENEAWLSASRDQAIGLLRMVAIALPPMLQFSRSLTEYCRQSGIAPDVTDALDVVTSRLGEMDEALRQPPR